jgi:S-adenosylmethionine synthetase
VNSARGADHDKTYYAPSDIGALKTTENYTANDTVVCHGYAPLSNTEKLTVEIENFLNSKEFKIEHPYTGQDIKVLVIRKDNSYRITICVPFISIKTPSHQFYSEKKNLILDELREFISKSNFIEYQDFDLLINTKDVGSFCLSCFFWFSS